MIPTPYNSVRRVRAENTARYSTLLCVCLSVDFVAFDRAVSWSVNSPTNSAVNKRSDQIAYARRSHSQWRNHQCKLDRTFIKKNMYSYCQREKLSQQKLLLLNQSVFAFWFIAVTHETSTWMLLCLIVIVDCQLFALLDIFGGEECHLRKSFASS